jgi:hypothetical protein
MTAPTHRLTSAERDVYAADGFVLRPDVFTTTEVAAIVGECEALVGDLVARRRAGRKEYGSYVFEQVDDIGVTVKWEGDTDVVHGVEPFAHHWPALERWAMDPRFVDPMRDLCADEAPILYTEKLNLKRPRHGGVNPLHQDYPYWTSCADQVERIHTAMLFLDDASRDNGCLEVLPGSHRLGVQPMRTDKDGFGNLEMDPTPFRDAPLVPIEVAAGAVLFFGPLLVHKSEPNTSTRERRTLLYSYQPAGCRQIIDFFPPTRAETATTG